MSTENERWLDIPGYEEEYAASNLGSIKNLRTGRILKPRRDRYGYLNVDIKGKRNRIHRLVAKTFLENPNNYNIVNHKNGIKTDNRVENLEWTTARANNQHARSSGVNFNSYHKVYATRVSDGKTFIFESTYSASQTLGVSYTKILRALRNQFYHPDNFIFSGVKQGYTRLLLTGKAKTLSHANPVGSQSNYSDNPVTTIPQKGSRADFVTARNGFA